MSERLVGRLLRLCFAESGSQRAAEEDGALRRATESDWRSALTSLDLHRLVPLAAWTLGARRLEASVPGALLSDLREYHGAVRHSNVALARELSRVLRELRKRGIEPVTLKGIVLAERFYPDAGTRPVQDVDLLLTEPRREDARGILEDLGFRRDEAETTERVDHFENEAGARFGVRHSLHLFDGLAPGELTTAVVSRSVPGTRLAVFEPTAMLVHLLDDMGGHLGATGYFLRMIADLAFLLKEWGTRIDLERLHRLLPRRLAPVLYESLGFIRGELGAEIPTPLGELPLPAGRLSLEEALRSRRLALWDLPRPSGWARLVARRLGVKVRAGVPPLEGGDLLRWPRDRLRRAARRARARVQWRRARRR